jgi:ketosteroid isomerase-like protein
MRKRKRATSSAGLLSVLLAAAALAAICGCDYLEKRRIERTLKERAGALVRGDVKAYLSFFAPDYYDRWMSFELMRTKAVERLKKEPRPLISFGKREINIRGDQAVVVERFTMEDKVEGRARRYDEVQHLLLKRSLEGWVCRRGSEVMRLLSGRMEEEYGIEQTLLRREAALVKEDIRAYMSLVSPGYKYKGEGFADLRKSVLQNFRVYDDIQFRSYDRKIWFFGDAATVKQKFTMHAVQMGKPMTFSREERFELEKTGDGWKFTMGL